MAVRDRREAWAACSPGSTALTAAEAPLQALRPCDTWSPKSWLTTWAMPGPPLWLLCFWPPWSWRICLRTGCCSHAGRSSLPWKSLTAACAHALSRSCIQQGRSEPLCAEGLASSPSSACFLG